MARLAYSLSNNTPRQHARPHSEPKHQRLVEDDDNSVLDENILDCNSPGEMSPNRHGQRKDSFHNPTAFVEPTATFSQPREGPWHAFSISNETPSIQASSSPHIFVDNGVSTFVRPDVAHASQYSSQASAWQMSGSQGSCTPTTAYESFSPDYDVKPQMATFNNDAAVTIVPTLPNIYGAIPMRSTYHPGAPISTSPQSGQDWMSNSSSDPIEIQSGAKHSRIQSPTYQSNPPHMRPDGIRKKNARFEIPAERTLRTIDNLINQTNDEQIIKELKQQKRLLRNRQAALDSRQRKKQHTERLEEEKKQTSSIINELEVELGEMKLREGEWIREREALHAHNRSLQAYVDELNMEKEDMLRIHTIEMGELRKKNAFLTEQAQKFESMSMSAVPSSAGYSAEFSDFDHLAMESGGWDNFSVVNDFNMETEARQENSLVVLPKKEKLAGKDEDKSTASSLLLMLLLCGAWVASNSTSSGPAVTPRVSDDVRVASTIVLENIYRDAGLQPLQTSILSSHRAAEKQLAQSSMKTTLSAVEIASLSNSPLASLHQQLITPSAEQQRDQAFSLSASQYNGINSGDFFHEQKLPLHPARKSIAETFANMRSDKHAPAAEIYTRSLLWDEIPATVVRDFARMVAESNPGSASQDNVEPMS